MANNLEADARKAMVELGLEDEEIESEIEDFGFMGMLDEDFDFDQWFKDPTGQVEAACNRYIAQVKANNRLAGLME